jgi:hypothetical protein
MHADSKRIGEKGNKPKNVAFTFGKLNSPKIRALFQIIWASTFDLYAKG